MISPPHRREQIASEPTLIDANAERLTPSQAIACPRGSAVINGRFLSQRGSGVQRFARELVLGLDAELARRTAGERRWVLMVPPGVPKAAKAQLSLQCIEWRVAGSTRGHLWDQLLRLHCEADDVLVNLANSGPILRSRSISILHDAAVYRTPANFSRAYRLFHQPLGRLISLRSVIGTVSQFSRHELADVLNLEAADIFVVPNSCEHLSQVTPDDSVLARLGVEPGRYFLAIGSPVRNKNLPAAIRAFTRLAMPSQKFVIVGAVDASVFGAGLRDAPPGVVLAGSISDAQVSALLHDATALVFPSLYEGFGIPPLEAMLKGCPVIASNIPPVVEVCGDAVLYFDPADVASITQAMQRVLADSALLAEQVRRGRARSALYSWQRSAQCLLAAVARLP